MTSPTCGKPACEHSQSPQAGAEPTSAIELMRAALQWYAEKVADCRKISGPGDDARHALDRDGGNRARAALHLVHHPNTQPTAALPCPVCRQSLAGQADALLRARTQMQTAAWWKRVFALVKLCDGISTEAIEAGEVVVCRLRCDCGLLYDSLDSVAACRKISHAAAGAAGAAAHYDVVDDDNPTPPRKGGTH